MNRTMTCWLLTVPFFFFIGPGVFGQSLKAVPRAAHPLQGQSTGRLQNRQPATRLVRAEESHLQLPEEAAMPAPSATDLERRRIEKQQRFQQIINRLKTLQDQMQQAREKQAAQRNAPTRSDAEEPSPSLDPESAAADSQDSAVTDSKTPDTLGTPTASDISDASLPDRPDADSDPEVGGAHFEGIDLSSDVLVDGPVNRVALADNLYRIKEYKLALEMYAGVDVRQLSDDQQFWVQFQTACCHRHLGDLVAARKQFRIIAGQPESNWLGRSSRWWLNTMRDRADLQEQLSAMQEQISMKREMFDDSKSEPK